MVNKIKSVYAMVLILTTLLFSFASAEVANYYPTYGEDDTGSSLYAMTSADLGKVNASDNNRYVSNSIWDHLAYQPNEYILWGFAPNLKNNVKVNDVKLSFEWQRDVYVTSVGRVLVWDQSAQIWVESLLHTPAANEDELETISLNSYINTAEDLNNLKIKFQETDTPYSYRMTKHDLVKLVVNYDLADEEAPTCSIDELYNKDSKNFYDLTSSLYVSETGDFYVYGNSEDDQSGVDNVQYNRTSPDMYFTFANADPKDGQFNSLIEAWQSDPNDKNMIEGNHTICCRVTDEMDNTAVGDCKTICIDTQDPEMVSISDNTEDCDDSLNYWNSDSIIWSFEADDDGCADVGSYDVELYLNDELFSSWVGHNSDELETTDLSDGSYYVKVRPVDRAGNKGDWMTSRTIIVDLTLPVVSIDSPEAGSWFKDDFEVTESDSDSNLLSCYYKIVNEDETVVDWTGINCNELLTIDVSEYCPEDGTCTVYKKATDKACNAFEISEDYNIDRVAPIASKVVGEPKIEAWGKWIDTLVNGWFIKDNTEIKINCDDGEGSGVAGIFYKINDGNWQDGTNAFTLPSDGLYNISYYCADNVGLESETGFEVDKVDTEAPSTTRNVLPYYVGNDKAWINCESREIFTCEDSEVGCDYVENYSLCATESAADTTTLNGCSAYQYFWRGIDRLGNVEEWNSAINWVDCEAPGIYVWNPTTEEADTQRCSMDVVIEVWDNGVGLNKSTVRGELRNESGVVQILDLSSIDTLTGVYFGGEFFTALIDLEGLTAGQYELVFYATDYLGNAVVEKKPITLEEGVYVEYLDPAYCDVESDKGGNCFFTLHACMRNSDSITMHMDKVNGGVVDPLTLNATISKGNQTAKVGLMNATAEISNAELLEFKECENVNGMETFDLELTFTKEVAAKIGKGPYTLNYNITSFDQNECLAQEA